MDLTYINLVLAWILVLFYLSSQAILRRWISILFFLLTFTILYLCHVDLTLNLVISFLVAMVSSSVLPLTTLRESFDASSTKEEDNEQQQQQQEKRDKSNTENTPPRKEETFLDIGKTFLNAYKSLSPQQIETMKNDTKDLIETQKSLLETIKSLSPIVTEGKQLLDTFKDYFGGSDSSAVLNQLKNTTQSMFSLGK